MPSVLGKRKSRAAKPEKPDISAEDAQEVFRRHFEAQFQPLKETKKPKKKAVVEEPEEDLDHEGDDDSWDGVSDSEEDTAPAIEVVDHTSSQTHDPTAGMSKRELKAFMSSRPPSATTSAPAPASAPKDADSDSDTERSLRKQDLALQRLLSESHLLSSLTPDTAHATTASAKLFASGKLRHRTTDLRIQSLTSASAPLAKAPDSLFVQKKMPMAMRKRITATQGAREDRRRREARENGIVLEREARKPEKDTRAKRERAIAGPAVGTMRGAELKLSDRDIMRIEGGGGRGGGRGRGGRGARGGGRGASRGRR